MVCFRKSLSLEIFVCLKKSKSEGNRCFIIHFYRVCPAGRIFRNLGVSGNLRKSDPSSCARIWTHPSGPARRCRSPTEAPSPPRTSICRGGRYPTFREPRVQPQCILLIFLLRWRHLDSRCLWRWSRKEITLNFEFTFWSCFIHLVFHNCALITQ